MYDDRRIAVPVTRGMAGLACVMQWLFEHTMLPNASLLCGLPKRSGGGGDPRRCSGSDWTHKESSPISRILSAGQLRIPVSEDLL